VYPPLHVDIGTPEKVLKIGLDYMSEVTPNSTTIGYLMTALHQKHKRQTFFLCNRPARFPRAKGSKNLDDGDTTQNGIRSFRGWLLFRMVFFPERRFPEKHFVNGKRGLMFNCSRRLVFYRTTILVGLYLN